MRALIGVGLALVTATCLLATVRDPHETALVWDVCPEGCPYKRIQPALNAAAGAASPETATVVMVSPGTYRENLTIGTVAATNTGNIKLIGFSRESVRILAPDAAIPAITVNGLASEISDLTIVSNNLLGQAITFTATQENRGRIINVEARCESQVVPLGCIWWNNSSAAGTFPRLELRDTTVRFGTIGVLFSSGGRVLTANNVIETVDNLGGAGAAFGYWWTPSAGSVERTWIGTTDYVRIRKTTSGGGNDVFGIDLNAQGPDANSYLYGMVIDVEDLGVGAAATVGGIGFTGAGDATALDRCFDCDVRVNRPNSTGSTRAAFNVNANASTVILYGGRYRATNSDGSDRDLFQNGANPILAVEGADFFDFTGLLAGGAGNGADTKTFASRDFLQLNLSADSDADSLFQNVRISMLEDGSSLAQIGTTAAGSAFVDALPQAFYHRIFGNSYQIATGTPTATARMTVLSGGEIGIGTTTPVAGTELEVNGQTRLDALFTQPLATAPATCAIGDWYVDTSGAYCACIAINTWEDMTDLIAGVGGCL